MRPVSGARRSGELQIELSLTNRRLLCGNSRHSAARFTCSTLIEGLLGDGLVTHQLLAARSDRPSAKARSAFARCEIGLGLIKRGLERTFVDGKEKLPFLYHLTVLEVRFYQR